MNGYSPTWCPGCGNYGIWAALKLALSKAKIAPDHMAVVYGIGCSGNMNDFLWVNSFHALHGRAIPVAIGIKIANHNLPVIAVVGDGDCYGEGGNHLIHACRGNHDVTAIVHDNRVYGLTTGQVAPTALKGFKAKSTPDGVIELPLNPLSLVLTSGATFVAQGFSGDINHLTDIILNGIKHKGFSLINVLQPCVTFNRLTTYDWYREKILKIDDKNYDSSDFREALGKSLQREEKIPIGILYRKELPTYTDNLPQLKKGILTGAELEIDLAEYISDFA